MTKKKIVSLSLVIALLATLVVGGTMAYFTDKDAETNTFTVGNVSIDLIEVFDEDSAVLNPGGKDQNAINKDVTVKNDGKNPAWVRVKIYIPSQLDQLTNPDYIDNHETAASFNTVHMNTVGANDVIWNVKAANNEAKQVNKDGKDYNEYIFYYNKILPAGETTAQLLDQVYLDDGVDCDVVVKDGVPTYVWTKDGKPVNYQLENGLDIIVEAEAIQAAGFDTYAAAFEAFDAQK